MESQVWFLARLDPPRSYVHGLPGGHLGVLAGLRGPGV